MITRHDFDKYKWIEVIEPTSEELKTLATEFSLHENAVEDCLDPEHLPKIESFDNYWFIISRYFDSEAKRDADTTQELTRKMAAFVGDKFLITIQRKISQFQPSLRNEMKNLKSPWAAYINVGYFIHNSYGPLLTKSSTELEALEGKVFRENAGKHTLQQIHLVKRKHAVVRHVLSHIQSLTAKIPETKPLKSSLQDLKEEQDLAVTKNNSLLEESTSLLQLYLSVKSDRTNEIMRLLTIVSVFFMPLNFLAGVYGMNIKNLPLSEHPQAFTVACIAFVVIGILVYLWFKAKRLLK